jgi:predicted Zn-dependent protease
MESSVGASVPAFLRTHPLTEKRVDRVKQELPEVGGAGEQHPGMIVILQQHTHHQPCWSLLGQS